MKYLALAAFAILCYTGCTSKSPKVALLRLKYYRGQRIDIKYRDYIVADDNPNEPVSNEYARLGLQVDSIMNDSLYQMSAKYDYYRVENDRFMNDQNYTSDRPERQMSAQEKTINQKLRPFLDSAYKFTVSSRGTLVKPFTLSNGLRIPKDLLLFDYDLYQINFPKDSLAIGDAWTNQSNSAINKTKRELKYHIESIYDQTIQIRVSGILTAKDGQTNSFKGYYFLHTESNKLDSMQIETEGKLLFHDKAKKIISITAH